MHETWCLGLLAPDSRYVLSPSYSISKAHRFLNYPPLTIFAHSVVEHLRQLTNLKVLNMSFCSLLTGSGVSQLSACANIQALFLRCCGRLSDACFDEIAELHGLQELDVTGCHLVCVCVVVGAGLGRGIGYISNAVLHMSSYMLQG